MDLGRVMGVGRWGVVGGALLVSGGFALGRPAVAWGGVALAGVALAVNTAGKLAYYGGLPIPRGHRVPVALTWTLVAAGVFAMLADYTYARTTPSYESQFWALLVGTAGFAAVYVGLRNRYVPSDTLDE
ncbi:MAG: hypothetical protein ABEI75_04860 [Halobaculum sp.]